MKNTPTFQNFWDAYDLKRDRLRAERAWNRLSANDKRDAVARIAAYREDCDRRGVSRMYAQGYLNNRRWEDDFSSSSARSAGIDTAVEQTHSVPPALSGMEEW